MFFKINNLIVRIHDKTILDGFNLDINKGEVHAIMGPNGCGKSTLSKTIMGSKDYEVVEGTIEFNDKNITNLKTDERARMGIFLSMQNPVSVDGLSNVDFLRNSLGAIRNGHINLYDFMNQIESAAKELSMNQQMIHRSINVGFSGGEKKKNEILQLKILEPHLIILDEIDSGLDIDSLRIVCDNINHYKMNHKDCAILLITHYPRIFDYINPDYVHMMNGGKIVKTGNKELASLIEEKGYQLNNTSVMKENSTHA